MNLAEFLTYADIRSLREIASHCQLNEKTHSKHELIRSLLYTLQRPLWWVKKIQSLSPEERRFWQLLCFDSRNMFNIEELLGKARQACLSDETDPRTLVTRAIKSGIIFSNRSYFHVPSDLRKRIVRIFRDNALSRIRTEQPPDVYREETNCLVTDLYTFLKYVGTHDVKVTANGAIYRRDLQTLFKEMTVQEELAEKEQWRFGFGRRYHQYPDRFSLLYDYAYFRDYIVEIEHAIRLNVDYTKESIVNREEAEQLYRFWVRLYRRPLPNLPLILNWLLLLSQGDWIRIEDVKDYLSEWLPPYYYMTTEDLFKLIYKMLLHLGVIRVSSTTYQLTEIGVEWVTNIAGWDLHQLEERYISCKNSLKFLSIGR